MAYNKVLKFIPIIRRALKEDLGRRDITTEFVIAKDKFARAVLLAKENCAVCGLDIAGLAFKLSDSKIKFTPLVKDGQPINKGRVLAKIQGKARSILTAERVALNFLSLLSGIATKTKKYVEAARPYKVKIMDTRKTIPGLRELQKYAVRVGGGLNHRMRLDEMVLIKDNHITIVNPKSQIPNPKSQIPNLQSLIRKAREKMPKIKIEIEVKNLREFKKALKAEPDIIMLDNMSIKDVKKAVILRRTTNHEPRTTILLEASGGITLEKVKRVAATGVDMISIGELTDTVNSVDISLEVL